MRKNTQISFRQMAFDVVDLIMVMATDVHYMSILFECNAHSTPPPSPQPIHAQTNSQTDTDNGHSVCAQAKSPLECYSTILVQSG